MVRQNLPFVNPYKERNGYTNLLPAPRHPIAFHIPGEGVQEDLLNPPTDWGQAGCLLDLPPRRWTWHFPFSTFPHHHYLYSLHHHTNSLASHTPYSSYNYGDSLTSIHISKLFLIILLPLVLYHNLPFQNNTLTYMASFKASGIWLRFFKDTLALSWFDTVLQQSH